MLICLSGQLEDPRTRCDIFKEQSDKDVSVVYGKLPLPSLPQFSVGRELWVWEKFARALSDVICAWEVIASLSSLQSI